MVFIDPPYDVPDQQVQQILRVLADGWLAPGAVVVVERGAAGLEWPDGFTDQWTRSFGGTHLLRAVWYRPD